MSTAIETKRYKLEAKPASETRRRAQPVRRQTEDSFSVLIRLPDLTVKDEVFESEDPVETQQVAPDRPKREKRSQRRKSRTSTETSSNAVSEKDGDADSPVWTLGWQVIAGVALCAVFSLAYVALTGDSTNTPDSSEDDSNDLFIELPGEDDNSSFVATDEPAVPSSSVSEPRVADKNSVDGNPKEPSPVGDFERQDSNVEFSPVETTLPERSNDPAADPSFEVRPKSQDFEFERPPSDSQQFQRQQFEPREIENQQLNPHYPATDSSIYPPPQTGSTLAPSNNSVDNRGNPNEPGVATLQGRINPPEFKGRERR